MKRYIAQPGDWAMAESKDGAWMRYEDHAAEVARLTAALEAAEELNHVGWAVAKARVEKLNAAESELADLRGRVERAEALLTTDVAGGRVPLSRLARQVLEALRGR